MNRLTTDNPESNYELGLNLAYVKDDEVWLRLGPDMNLCEYAAKQCPGFGCPGVTPEEVMETGLLDCGDCPVAMLYATACQAAAMREKLKRYENLGLDPEEMGWTSMDERPPTSPGIYLASIWFPDLGVQLVDTARYSGDGIWSELGMPFSFVVTHWRPKPEPAKRPEGVV